MIELLGVAIGAWMLTDLFGGRRKLTLKQTDPVYRVALDDGRVYLTNSADGVDWRKVISFEEVKG